MQEVGMCILLIIIIVVVIASIFIANGVKDNERKLYNGGICPNCGSKLICHKIKDTAEKDYVCENLKCSYRCRITTNIDE